MVDPIIFGKPVTPALLARLLSNPLTPNRTTPMTELEQARALLKSEAKHWSERTAYLVQLGRQMRMERDRARDIAAHLEAELAYPHPPMHNGVPTEQGDHG